MITFEEDSKPCSMISPLKYIRHTIAHHIFISILSSFIACHSFSQHFPSNRPEGQIDPMGKVRSLNYIKSTQGLSSPAWYLFFSGVEFADINADGHPDIVTIGDAGSPSLYMHGIMVYFGDGKGNWSLQMSGNFGYGGIATGDVNGDGLMDVGYGMVNNYGDDDYGDQALEVALGDGSGLNWWPWDDGLAPGNPVKFGPIDLADIDNDGDLDIGAISTTGDGIYIYKNMGDGSWQLSFHCQTMQHLYMVFQFGDIDNDGMMDFISDSGNGTAYFGDGKGQFTLNDQGLPPIEDNRRTGLSLGSSDSHGGLLLSFIHYQDYYGQGPVKVYKFNPLNQSWEDYSVGLPDEIAHYAAITELTDMNMDGWTDVVTHSEEGGICRIYTGNGQGAWEQAASFSLGSTEGIWDMTTGDTDHNGYPDLLVMETQKVNVFTYMNFLLFYKESSMPEILDINPQFPSGQELLINNGIRDIRWVSAIPEGETSRVRLELSLSGPNGPWTTIADNLPDNGRYQWTVPAGNSDQCYIRYGVNQGAESKTCISRAPFTITDSQGITELESPGIQVSPNPAREKIQIYCSQPLAILVMTDLTGKKLKTFKKITSFPFSFDLSTFPAGVYLLSGTTEDGNSGKVKFIKTVR